MSSLTPVRCLGDRLDTPLRLLCLPECVRCFPESGRLLRLVCDPLDRYVGDWAPPPSSGCATPTILQAAGSSAFAFLFSGVRLDESNLWVGT